MFRVIHPALRAFFAPVIVASIAALAAACSSSGGGRTVTPAQPDFGPISNVPVSGETLGNGSVRVALLLPMSATGNAGTLATNMRNAAELALQEPEGSGITILLKDTSGTPEGARTAAHQAIQEGAQLILGPPFAQEVTGAASVARAANVPIIAFSTDTANAAPGVYLLSFLPQTDIARTVHFASMRGKRAVAALVPESGYGTVAEAALQQAAAQSGIRVVALERYQLDRVAMQQKAEQLAALVASGQADTIFLPDAGDAAPFLAQIMAAKGVRRNQITYLGSGLWDDRRIQQESNLFGGWYSAPDKAGFAEFSRRYRTAYGRDPLRTATLAYDATRLAAGLATRYGNDRYSARTLTNPNGFLGVDGVFRLLADGTNQRGLAVYEIGARGTQIVDPAPSSFSRPGF